jgi:imidazolonepropionase
MLFLQGMRKLFVGIRRIWGVDDEPVSFRAGEEMSVVESVSNAWLLVENGRISGWGSMDEHLPGADEVIDLGHCEVLPGLVDSHTHVVFAEPRTQEWEMRIKGATYEEIAASGGGILNSAQKLRNKDESLLFDESLLRVQRMMEYGTTCIEIKSGYGLSFDSEIKMLRVARKLGEKLPVTIKTTFLGSHAIPAEYKSNREGYLKLIIEQMLPAVSAEGLADHVDVFCDRGFFTPDETIRILEAADKLGLPGKIHANELGITGGVQAAVHARAWSADHLEHIGNEEIECLLNSEVIPVGLPGTSYFLGIPYAPGRKMIDSGLPFALASDFNPGSSPVCSLQMIWSLACTQMKLMPSEAFHAITINAARALRQEKELGSIMVGKRADFWATDSLNAIQTIPYYFGVNHARKVFVEGNQI